MRGSGSGHVRFHLQFVTVVVWWLSLVSSICCGPSTSVTKTFWGFSNLADIDMDPSNNLYVIDQDNQHILKYSTSGTLLQEYYVPYSVTPPQYVGVAYDSTNNVIWFCDDRHVYHMNNANVPTAFVTDIFQQLGGLCTDSSGHVYIVDNTVVYKYAIGESLIVSFVSTSTGTELNGAKDCYVDSNGYVYVADSNNRRIVKFTSGGTVSQVFTGLTYPTGITMDTSGNMYITQASVHNVVKMSSEATIVATYTAGGNLASPMKSVLDSEGHLWTVDSVQNQIFELSSTDITMRVISANQALSSPWGIAADSMGNIWMSDENSNLYARNITNGVMKVYASYSAHGIDFTPAGSVVISAGSDIIILNENTGGVKQTISHIVSTPEMNTPWGIAVASNGDIFASDNINNVVFQFDSSGSFIRTFSTSGTLLSSPTGIAVANGYLYCVDTDHNRIIKWLISDGSTQMVLFDTSPVGGFLQPSDVAVTSNGNIYVADRGHGRIAVFSAGGIYLTAYAASTATHPLHDPVGVTFDTFGNMFVVDHTDNRVVMFGASGAITGDPQFKGLQGQDFQIHGTPGEYFNLISSPQFQLNSRFVFLNQQAVGHRSCSYNNTACWSHDGTYLDVIGLMWPGLRITLTAGTHQLGLRMEVNGVRQEPQELDLVFSYNSTDSSSDDPVKVLFPSHGEVTISFSMFHIRFVNSHLFFNLEVTCQQHDSLTAGRKQHDFTGEYDSLDDVYPDIPLHGLLGQTWRNARYGAAHHPYQGVIDDYMAPDQDLFSTRFMFNLYTVEE